MKKDFKLYNSYVQATNENCFEFSKRFLENHNIYPGNYWENGFYKNWKEVSFPKFLNVILFLPESSINGHIGIYLWDNYFIHATEGKVYISKLSLFANKNPIEGFYEWQN